MAQHEVKFNVPKRPLAHKDIEFEIDQNGRKFGELRVSKGGVLWVPRNDQLGFKLPWRKLAQLAEEFGTKERR
jgi:hypothetical protein